ncbi:MAG: sigma-70 family RNA polymerase sigma factor [Chloroflexota bacterium]|nr:sigma-70 family RNA polymerase sigma factor [Chloroflexota bacterium]
MIEPNPEPLVGARDGDETALVNRAKGGDGDAFDALVELRLMPTFRLARAILGTTEEAEDATQEAFIAAWRSLPSLNDPGRFDAWFTRIVVNTCRMSLRRRPRGIVVSIDSIADAHALRGDDPTLDGLAETDALNRAIDLLPVQQRAILALYYLEDRPLLAVATILGIPAGTVKWRLSEARAGLRRALAANDEFPSERRGTLTEMALTADQTPIVQPLPEGGA